MPANLPPQYIKLEEEYRSEREPKRRLELLQQMLSEIPKHKGTDHLQGELKSKISKLKSQLKSQKKTGTSKHQALDHIPREGAGQFVLFGPPNSGKSSVIAELTNAHVEPADWPFATRKPAPGMAAWENVKLQLVDTPSIAPEYCETYVFNIIRTGDVAVLVLSLGDDDLLEQYDFVIKRVHQGKVRLSGLVESDAQLPTALDKPTLVLATGMDRDGASERLELLKGIVDNGAPVLSVSAKDKIGLQEFLKTAFLTLGLIRVYTKAPGQEPDLADPVLLQQGGTVGDAAREIHKDIAERLQFARLWSASNPATHGLRVPTDHQLEEGDILEFHI